jgi:type IV secretion system protein VirD4
MTADGVVIGRTGRHILRFCGEENVLVCGPERSGKGTGVFIPTLLESTGHVVVVDVRGQTYDATAGWQVAKGHRVLRLALTQPGSTRFNLLQAIRRGQPQEFFDAATVAEMHVDPGGTLGGRRDHWDDVSKSLLTCAILSEVRTRVRPTMAQLASRWSQPGQEARQVLQQVVDTAPARPIAELGQEVLNKTDREASGVLSTMMRNLFLYRDPLLAVNTASSDFTLEDFTRHDRWLTLYLLLSPAEEEYVRPFMRALLRLALGRWMEEGPTRHRIRFLFDEFVSYGKVDFFVRQLSLLGGRGIRTVLGVQNIPQLTDTYGNADLITEKCKVRVFFAAQGSTTGREISRQTGTGTATTVQESQRAVGWSWAMADSRTLQQQQHSRPLLTDGEAMQIPPTHAVIQVAGHPSIWARKVRYWQHRTWRHRSQIPAPVFGGAHGGS